MNKNCDEKMVSFYSDYLRTDIDKNKVYVIYYDLPVNSVYWTIGLYNNGKCLNSVNMGKYQTTEKGDTLAIILYNNINAMKAGKKTITNEHNNMYLYKKLIVHSIFVESEFYIKFASFSNKFNNSPKLNVKEYIFKNLDYIRGNKTFQKESKIRNCEKIDFFNEVIKKSIGNNFIKVGTNIDTEEIDTSLECLTNRSEIFNVSKLLIKDGKQIPSFRVIAVDHFKSRAALHSHIIFFDADTHNKIDFEITGEISDFMNHNQMITCRCIKFIPPKEVKNMYAIEYIYYDFETGSKIKKESIIPMEIYTSC